MEHCGSLTKTRPGRRLWSKWHSEQRRRRRRTKPKRQTRERKKKSIMNTVSQFPCQRKENEKEQGGGQKSEGMERKDTVGGV
jgi:hypothetical protein